MELNKENQMDDYWWEIDLKFKDKTKKEMEIFLEHVKDTIEAHNGFDIKVTYKQNPVYDSCGNVWE